MQSRHSQGWRRARRWPARSIVALLPARGGRRHGFASLRKCLPVSRYYLRREPRENFLAGDVDSAGSPGGDREAHLADGHGARRWPCPVSLAALAHVQHEVVRIFQERCQTCHHAGDTRRSRSSRTPRSSSVAPISATKSLTRDAAVEADRRLRRFPRCAPAADDEIDTIARWVDAGAPEGNRADLRLRWMFPSGWVLGQPDLVSNAEPYTVPERADMSIAASSSHEPPRRPYVCRRLRARRSRDRASHDRFIDTTDAAKLHAGGRSRLSLLRRSRLPPARHARRMGARLGPSCMPDDVAFQLPADATHRAAGPLSTRQSCKRTRIARGLASVLRDEPRWTSATGRSPFSTAPSPFPPGEKRDESARLHRAAGPTCTRPHHAAHAPPRARDEGDRDLPRRDVRPLVYIDDWDFHWQANYTFENPFPCRAGRASTWSPCLTTPRRASASRASPRAR